MSAGFTKYRVELLHYDDGELEVHVFDVGDSQKDREAVAWALRQAAERVLTQPAVDLKELN